jgi:RNA polymerase sigma factor (sigma-70 family)
MAQGRSNLLRRHLYQVLHARHDDGLTDARLLERFLSERDEAAFAVLVRRHGGMVWRVCQRVLRHAQDSEDVFQATFLMLVRKAGSIGRGAALGAWLHRVAFRLALEARARRDVRGRREQLDPDLAADSAVAPGGAAVDRELAGALHEEIARLPKKYREPIILCYFEGKNYAEAATELLCPRGTLSIRLTRARELLRGRLVRRGVALSGTLASWLAVEAAPAAVSSLLVRATLRAATALVLRPAVAAGAIPEGVLYLLKGASQAMLWSKLKLAAIMVAIIGIGASVWACAAVAGPALEAPQVASSEGGGKGWGTTHPSPRPLGTWERDSGPYHLRLRVDNDRLFATLSFTAENKPVSVTLEADYGVTTDSLLYGVVTSVEEGSAAERDRVCSDFIDQPFSAHFRVGGGSLTVKNLKFMGGKGGALAEVIHGRYTRADAAHSAAKRLRVPLLPPGGGPTFTPDLEVLPKDLGESPPDDAEILRAMPRLPPGTPYVYEVCRDDLQIVKERVRARVEAPRFYPLAGRCRLQHEHWKCTVAYTQVEKSSYPFPFQRKTPRVEVVYIDKDHLEPLPE